MIMSDVVGRVIPIQKKDSGELIQTISQYIIKVDRLQGELKNCRNELCMKCGNYKEAHLGACDDCRYRHGGEWSVDLNG